MTQRYFAEGSNGLNIRNSSNVHVLMNNADERTNCRVACMMGLRKDFDKAVQVNSTKLYPYIVINRSNHARVSGTQLYTDIFSQHRQIVFNSMTSYILSEADFKKHFKIIEGNYAISKNENPKEKLHSSESSENQSESVCKITGVQRRQETRRLERVVGNYLRKRRFNSKL